jgi:hypothetical protein
MSKILCLVEKFQEGKKVYSKVHLLNHWSINEGISKGYIITPQ